MNQNTRPECSLKRRVRSSEPGCVDVNLSSIPAPPEDETTDITTGVPEVAVERRDRLTLVALMGHHGQSVFIVDSGMVLGRYRGCDIRIDDSGLSRKHVRFYQLDGRWYVEDLQSRNGTIVNGVQIHRPRMLADGDRIQIGTGTVFRASLQDSMEQAATQRMYESTVRDPLTRAYNRGYLDKRLDEELAFANRHGTELSVLLLDVDHFKNVNDSYGHQAGDAVLRVLAALLKRIVRTEDVVARYGGEEFAVVARGINERNALIFAERIRKTFAATRVPWEGDYIAVTLSIGIATCRIDRKYATPAALLAVADEALYAAKAQGRNRSIIGAP